MELYIYRMITSIVIELAIVGTKMGECNEIIISQTLS